MPKTLGMICFFALPLTASAALADGDSLVLYGEPTSYTDVVDAFDGEDPFDLNVRLQFRRSMTTGTIQREVNDGTTADGRGSASWVNIANHERVRNILDVGLDVGIFHDLAIFARLPVVLSDDRSLEPASGRTAASISEDLQVTEPGGTATPLFDVPFVSPTRSGLDYVAVGAAWSIFNQYRDRHLPTWLLMVEGRFGVGSVLKPCVKESVDGSGVRCRDGQSPGISEGINTIRVETRASKRFRYYEPYGGISFEASWPGIGASNFEPGGDLPGFTKSSPPWRTEVVAGMAVIPWEERERYQRFVFDGRLFGGFVSEGRGYSPLFDALGTSDNEYFSGVNRECADCTREVPYTGTSVMESHGRFGGEVAVEVQAAKYVRFRLSSRFTWDLPYAITFTDPCNPDVNASPDDPRIGGCNEGILNPNSRAVVDSPGSRFRLDGDFTVDLAATAIAQF